MSPGFSLGKLFTNGHNHEPESIKPGMRYRQTPQLGRVWVVKRKLEPAAAMLPHVMIYCEDYELETRVIAESALKDAEYFKFLPESKPAEASEKSK